MTTRQPYARHAIPALILAAALAIVTLAGTLNVQAAGDQPQFADLIEANSPAVVNIRTTMPPSGHGPALSRPPQMSPGDPFDDFFRRFFEQTPRSGPRGPAVGQGSGFIISADGHVVTNHHVIENADEISVVKDDGTTYAATLVGADPKTDLAVLKIEADGDLPFVHFGDSDKARIGDWIIAIGNPFGLGGTATAGIISARGRDLQAGPYDDFIQIDAPINRGNSGGPVFNTDGEVIGVNTMIYSPNGGNVGIGFAIPSAVVTEIVADLKADGTIERGWLGVQIQAVTDEIAESLGLDGSEGALVTRVEPGSPADKADLEAGDVIVDFDGKRVGSVKDLTRMVARTDADETVDIVVWRDGKRREREVRVGLLADQPARVAGVDEVRPGKLGLELSPLTPAARRQFGIPAEIDGALVVGVDPRGPAAKQGVRTGDVITMVGKTPVTSPEDVRERVDAAAGGDRDHVLMRVERGGFSRYVAMKLA